MAIDMNIQGLLGDAQIEGRPAPQLVGKLAQKAAVEGDQRNLGGAVHAAPGQGAQQLLRVTVGVDGDPFGRLRGPMQFVGIRKPDFRPEPDDARIVPGPNGGFIAADRANAAPKGDEGCEVGGVLQAIRQYPGQHVVDGLGRMLGDLEGQRFVHAAVNVAEGDVKGMQGCADGHGSRIIA